jgi:hypothetical protein
MFGFVGSLRGPNGCGEACACASCQVHQQGQNCCMAVTVPLSLLRFLAECAVHERGERGAGRSIGLFTGILGASSAKRTELSLKSRSAQHAAGSAASTNCRCVPLHGRRASPGSRVAARARWSYMGKTKIILGPHLMQASVTIKARRLLST